MPKQRTYYSLRTHVFPDDFPQRLERFKVESGLSWSEIARRLGTCRHTVWRWWQAGVRPNQHHTEKTKLHKDSFDTRQHALLYILNKFRDSGFSPHCEWTEWTNTGKGVEERKCLLCPKVEVRVLEV